MPFSVSSAYVDDALNPFEDHLTSFDQQEPLGGPMPPTALITKCETKVDQLHRSEKDLKDLKKELNKLTSSKFAALDKKIIAKLLVAFIPIGGAAIVAGSPALLGLLGGALIGIVLGICASCFNPKAFTIVGILGALAGGVSAVYFIANYTTLFQTTTGLLLTPLLNTPIGWLLLGISALCLIGALASLPGSIRSVRSRTMVLRKEILNIENKVLPEKNSLKKLLVRIGSDQLTIKLKDALTDLTTTKLG